MITGFNTDIEHNGVVYHVQTEDKGLDSPIILSLVYAGGAILASKRAPYEDLIASGFNEGILSERLKRQHRLICAAILAGRIEDLKRMASRTDASATMPSEETELTRVLQSEPATSEINEPQSFVQETQPELETQPEPPAILNQGSSVYSIHDSRRNSPLGELRVTDEGLVVTLLNDQEFRSGDSLMIRVMVSQRSGGVEKPLNNVEVSLKVLGTTFRPQIHSAKTERDGVATVATQIPEFTSGRAAVLVRAVVQGQSTEIRRVVYPRK